MTAIPAPAQYHEKEWIYKEDGVIAQQRLAVVKDRHPEKISILDQGESFKVPDLRLISPLQRWHIS